MTDPNIISYLLNAGFGGVILFLFLKGYVFGKPSMDKETRTADQWRKLYETERAAHELTRKGHAEETRAALQSAAEGSKTAAVLLAEIKSRLSEGPR
ncbi:unnamed protein product [[Actinomadura] parvosata subsp. kistnae]|uniref:Uncharacterized protein n=1 Tax=[Actinomadura] parvosata subsp. kistnae TaxID=1909395 RepID=A0A1V0ABR0_9ACTN|nr:hypothetical protein [Nonomuraea sp. ATCC 55076]AQZ67645.1 hypothetical protein BKM31_44810 [Nonomuraea sp. ATCC 55076]SPL94068.1 unnamed protein product [Actinomadura parvosata subsp. kistnae]